MYWMVPQMVKARPPLSRRRDKPKSAKRRCPRTDHFLFKVRVFKFKFFLLMQLHLGSNIQMLPPCSHLLRYNSYNWIQRLFILSGHISAVCINVCWLRAVQSQSGLWKVLCVSFVLHQSYAALCWGQFWLTIVCQQDILHLANKHKNVCNQQLYISFWNIKHI